MGVNKRQREMQELKEQYVKKSSCYLLVALALLVGAFVGNTVTMLYMGQQSVPTQQVSSAPTQQQSQASPTADPNTLAALEAEAAANPTDSGVWVKLGNYCFDHGLPGKAVSAYERALELKPMQVGVWSDLGVMYRRTKQFEKAVDAFEQAAAIDPKHIVSRFNMGVVYMHDLSDRAGALKAWKSVLAIDPEAKTPGGQSVAKLVEELEK